jgi:hypothetical protein
MREEKKGFGGGSGRFKLWDDPNKKILLTRPMLLWSYFDNGPLHHWRSRDGSPSVLDLLVEELRISLSVSAKKSQVYSAGGITPHSAVHRTFSVFVD